MTTMTKFGSIALVAVALTGMSDTAFASFVIKASAEQRAACTSDVFRLCKAEIPNVTKIIACLKKEKTNLSPLCQTVFVDQAETQQADSSAAQKR